MMQFLKYRLHLPGRSSKQIKKIEGIINSYEFDTKNNNVLFKTDSGMRKIPQISERENIIKTAHEQGHFQVDSTYERIKRDFIWKNMKEDISKIIKFCQTCQLNQKAKVYDHPAKAIKIDELNERIHIDLVFGLPQTEEGYNGIFLVVEALTKFPLAFPIKSKNSSEISECLLEYISLFGPPKTILSDQGREFKGTVEKMIKSFG